MRARSGVTLVELIVVIALLSVVASVTGLALLRARPLASVSVATAAALVLRDSALHSGRSVSGSVRVGGRSMMLSGFPDGRVVADRGLGIDPLSGRVAHAAR